MNTSAASNHRPGFALHFRSLFDDGRGWRFPCDAAGRVDLDALSERSRNNYFYARAAVGRDLSAPAVQPDIEPC